MAKVLVALMSADKPAYVARRTACLETWAGKGLPGYVTMSVWTGKTLESSDEYSETSARLKALCRKALQVEGWDWLLKLDDDVVVFWPSAHLPPQGSAYHGSEVPGNGLSREGQRYVAGAAMWLGRKAVEVLATEMQASWGIPDDHQTGEILRKYNILPTYDLYHFIIRRPGQMEVSPFDSEMLIKRGIALEVGSPENMRQLYYDAVTKPPESRKAIFDTSGKSQPKRGPAIFNPDLVPGYEQPAISRPHRDPGFRLYQR